MNKSKTHMYKNVTINDPGEPPSFNSSHTRTSDIVDAGDTVGQDFDRSDISIHEAQLTSPGMARIKARGFPRVISCYY
jgi:hypothetical protein